jgi:peptidylprolyl isomerase
MKRGEKAILVCSPDFAYGSKGSGASIPPNSTLHFTVELLDFKDKKKEKYELSEEEKLTEANKLKEAGNDHFKAGRNKEATASYT